MRFLSKWKYFAKSCVLALCHCVVLRDPSACKGDHLKCTKGLGRCNKLPSTWNEDLNVNCTVQQQMTVSVLKVLFRCPAVASWPCYLLFLQSSYCIVAPHKHNARCCRGITAKLLVFMCVYILTFCVLHKYLGWMMWAQHIHPNCTLAQTTVFTSGLCFWNAAVAQCSESPFACGCLWWS